MSKADDIRVFLEGEIAIGNLPPGSNIEEKHLAAQFKVSRTPVREALLQLAYQGLVDVKQGRRATVARFSIKQVTAMMEVVAELEGLAAALAARRMLPAERSALQSLHEKSEHCVSTGDIEGYFALNTEFHNVIYDGSRNDYLATSIRNIRARMRLYHLFPFQRTGRMRQSFSDHQRVMKAIVGGDEEEADLAMRQHMTRGGQVFVDLVSDLPAEDD